MLPAKVHLRPFEIQCSISCFNKDIELSECSWAGMRQLFKTICIILWWHLESYQSWCRRLMVVYTRSFCQGLNNPTKPYLRKPKSLELGWDHLSWSARALSHGTPSICWCHLEGSPSSVLCRTLSRDLCPGVCVASCVQQQGMEEISGVGRWQ